MTAEDFVAKITPWPQDLEFPSSPKMIGQHLILKAISLAVVTPFYSVSLIESVQSDIASETPVSELCYKTLLVPELADLGYTKNIGI